MDQPAPVTGHLQAEVRDFVAGTSDVLGDRGAVAGAERVLRRPALRAIATRVGGGSIHLDSPRGLALRYQYLDLPLSEPEKKTFFAQWGTELERLLHKRLSVIGDQAERLEFLHACHWPLRSVRLEIDLDRDYSIEELGHFRALAVIFDEHESSDAHHMYVGVS
jgi:hypothetical protein